MNFNRALNIYNILLDFIDNSDKAEEAAFAIEHYLENPDGMKAVLAEESV